MTSILESQAYFEQRADDIGVKKEVVEAFLAKGIKRLQTLAYSHGQPGQPIQDSEFKEWTKARSWQKQT